MLQTAPKQPNYGRRIKWLGAFVALFVALYSGGWLYAAHLIETKTVAALDKMRAKGLTADCASPTARGYPFRIGLFCDHVEYGDPVHAVSASAGAFRSAGQIYDPLHLVAELDGPAKATVPDFGDVALDWKRLHASVRLADPLPTRASVEGGAFVATTGDGRPLVSADSFEGHMRPNEGNLDLAFRLGGLAIDPALIEGRSVPALSGDGDISVKDGVRLVVDEVEDLRGQSATIRALSLSLGGAGAVALAGTVAVDENGLIDADLTLGVREPKALAAALATAFPESRRQIEQGFAGLAILGDQPSLPLKIVKGKASIGFIPLGTIKPLPAPQ